MRVFRIEARTGFEKQLNGLSAAESGGAVERSLSLRSAIPHDAIRVGAVFRNGLRIGSRCQQDSNDLVLGQALAPA